MSAERLAYQAGVNRGRMGKSESIPRSAGCGNTAAPSIAKDSFSSPHMPSDQKCVHCGRNGLQLREVARNFGKGKSLLAIKGIPMISCPHCEESWFTAQTMYEIEQIKRLRKSEAVNRDERENALRRAARRIESDIQFASIRAVSDDVGV